MRHCPIFWELSIRFFLQDTHRRVHPDPDGSLTGKSPVHKSAGKNTRHIPAKGEV
jgi:hypothetical protein